MDLFDGVHRGKVIAGVDEVGRGPLAGDVVAAAVILNPSQPIAGLRDSKKLTEKRREQLAAEIRGKALCFAVARASVSEIDSINILQASLLAMHRAVSALEIQPEYVMVDGNRLPRWSYASEAVVRGDDKVAEIAAASILAKVVRDNEMKVLDSRFPGYGLARHKGYPTPQHLAALRELGVCEIHRRSYAPVRAAIEAESAVSPGAEH